MKNINLNDCQYLMLIINPGSTSTKIALFNGDEELITKKISHSSAEIAPFKRIIEQKDFRYQLIKDFIDSQAISSLKAVVGRGGLIKPVKSGVYQVNQTMIDDLASGRFKEHASNLGGILAHQIAADFNCPAYIVDPVVVDEMADIARFTGLPEIERKSIFHALNQKSSARKAAQLLDCRYEAINLIVAHMGGGVSIGAHCRGQVIDVNNALDGEGPFSPERSGGLPVGALISLCFENKFTLAEIKKKVVGQGGLVAYCGTNSLEEIAARIEQGDQKIQAVFEAMAYQISKEIAAHGATLKGDIQAIVLTGGMAFDKRLVALIRERIEYLARVIVIPGEREMVSLAGNVYAVLLNKMQVKEY